LKKSAIETHRLLVEAYIRYGIGSIIGRFVPNAKRTCTYIRSDSTNNFISFKIVENDSKARELCSI